MNLDLTDIALDLGDAHDHAARLRSVLASARRRRVSLPATEALLAVVERRIERLDQQRLAMLAAIDKMAWCITWRAQRGLNHDADEVRLLALLGCEEFDERRWPYVAAALRAREQPTEETIAGYIRAWRALDGRMAA